jgi:hypothetical protein
MNLGYCWALLATRVATANYKDVGLCNNAKGDAVSYEDPLNLINLVTA